MTVHRSGFATVVLVIGVAAARGGSAPTPGVTPSNSLSPTSQDTSSPDPTGGEIRVQITRNVPFESESVNAVGEADLYTPGGTGPSPVAIMLHGGWGFLNGLDRAYLDGLAGAVAELGFMVSLPAWGQAGGAGTTHSPSKRRRPPRASRSRVQWASQPSTPPRTEATRRRSRSSGIPPAR